MNAVVEMLLAEVMEAHDAQIANEPDQLLKAELLIRRPETEQRMRLAIEASYLRHCGPTPRENDEVLQ